MNTYETWINEHVPNRDAAFCMCQPKTEAMAKAFPELKVVRGHIVIDQGAHIEHWWLETTEGTVIDPTAKQYGKIVGYEPFVPGTTVCVGRCRNCGWDIYRAVQTLDGDRVYICSTECEDELYRSLR